MFKNYFKIAVRSHLRQKTFAFINLFGLALGVACAIILGLWCYNELSYDSHHKNSQQIYRIADNIINDDGSYEMLVAVPAMWAPTLKEEFPEVLNYVRFYTYRSEILIKRLNSENNFYEANFCWADSTVFSVFTFPLLQGHLKTALVRPNTVVISQLMAKKYFGDEDPIGKQLTYVNQNIVFNLQVNWDYEGCPSNLALPS